MEFSHRDHRARRELRTLYLGFGAAVGVLTAVAILFPNVTIRLLAVAGLAVVGAAYVIGADRLADRYWRDLSAVRAGQPVSGEVRAEIYHEIGFERDREDDWMPSPSRHPDVGSDPAAPDVAEKGPPVMLPVRSDPPSDGS